MLQIKKAKTIQKSASWFIIIGAVAALTHYLVAVVLESLMALSPSTANLIGFLSAFPVSYVGHRFFSFSEQKTQHQQALPKFLLVAIVGFMANQTLLLLCLRFIQLPFWLVLGFVMLLVAVSTYLLSKYWAFKS